MGHHSTADSTTTRSRERLSCLESKQHEIFMTSFVFGSKKKSVRNLHRGVEQRPLSPRRSRDMDPGKRSRLELGSVGFCFISGAYHCGFARIT
jgi:hypothetical protein